MTPPTSSPVSVSQRGAAGGDAERTLPWVRGERVQPTDSAATLASWVDVPPLEPAGRTDHEDSRIMAGVGTRPSGPGLAAPDGESEEAAATVGVARGGP